MATIKDAVGIYLLDCQTRNLRPESIKTYRRHLSYFLAYAHATGAAQLDQVDAQTLRSYLARLQARQLKPSTIRTAGRTLRIFIAFCVADGMLDDDPTRRVRLPRRPTPRPDAFTAAEVQRIIRAARTKRDRAIVLCLLDSGCRVGEFTAWRREDIDTAAGTVSLRAETTKTNTGRTIYLGKRSRTALARYIDEARPRDLVWLAERSPRSPLTVDGMKRAIQRIGKRARVQPAGPHKYRRTFATFALARGMSIYDVAAILGHARIDTLKHYIKQDGATLAAAHARAGPIDHLLK